jgi:tRNA pseudouridine38-40 synthase
MMRNLMITLAYDGTDFHGWQFQPELRTVQGCLEQALRRVLRHQVVVIGCSRTDSGVHAAGHVANVYTTNPAPVLGLFRSLGSRLPKDMSAINMMEVPLTFHSTRSAVSKLYRYRIYNNHGRPCEHLLQRYTYHCWHLLDLEAMRTAAEAWIGTHDFTSLASAGSVRDSNVRTVLRIEICRLGREVVFDIEGSGFLYRQVRNMVGVLVEIGRGQWLPSRAKEVLDARDRSAAGPTAPARGLCLQWLKYDIPGLPPPSPELSAKAERAQPPAGAARANDEVEDQPRSGAPMPLDVDTEEEPGA